MRVLKVPTTSYQPGWFTSYIEKEKENLSCLMGKAWKSIPKSKEGPKHSFQVRKTKTGTEFLVPVKRLGEGAFRIVTKKLWIFEDGSRRTVAQYRPKIKLDGSPEKIKTLTTTLSRMQKEVFVFSLLYERFLPPAELVTYRSSSKIKTRSLFPCFTQDLLSFLEKNPSLSTEKVLSIALKLFQDLARLHEKKWCLLDIKATNICLNARNIPFFTDLEFAQEIGIASPRKGSPGWTAPEILEANRRFFPTGANDIWSFGMVLLLMVNKDLFMALYNSQQDRRTYFDWKNNFLNTHAFVQKSLSNFPHFLAPIIIETLRLTPENRPTAEELTGDLISLQKRLGYKPLYTPLFFGHAPLLQCPKKVEPHVQHLCD